jgi:hypothetical protein
VHESGAMAVVNDQYGWQQIIKMPTQKVEM